MIEGITLKPNEQLFIIFDDYSYVKTANTPFEEIETWQGVDLLASDDEIAQKMYEHVGTYALIYQLIHYNWQETSIEFSVYKESNSIVNITYNHENPTEKDFEHIAEFYEFFSASDGSTYLDGSFISTHQNAILHGVGGMTNLEGMYIRFPRDILGITYMNYTLIDSRTTYVPGSELGTILY